jgi:pyrophosphatase PpaX
MGFERRISIRAWRISISSISYYQIMRCYIVMASSQTSGHVSGTTSKQTLDSTSDGKSIDSLQGPFNAVLFDLDGTLLDTTQAIYESLKHTMRHFTGKTPEDEELHPYMGLPVQEQFSLLLPGQEIQACKVYETHNLSIHKDYVKPYPGAVDVLQALKTYGTKIALVTSKKRKTAVVGLEIAGIRHLFDATVFCDDLPEHKPHPAPVLKALELLGYIQTAANPDPAFRFRALTVGDSPWDIASAKNALSFLIDAANAAKPSGPRLGVPVIETAGVTYGAFPKEAIEAQNPDYILDSISQVLTLCGLDT